MNIVGKVSSVICFGTVGITDVGIWAVDDKRLEDRRYFSWVIQLIEG